MVPLMVAAFVVSSTAVTLITSTTLLWISATCSFSSQLVLTALPSVASVRLRVEALPALMVAVKGICWLFTPEIASVFSSLEQAAKMSDSAARLKRYLIFIICLLLRFNMFRYFEASGSPSFP